MSLKAEKISKRYMRKNGECNYFYAVKELDFEAQPGTLTLISGRSGSGKTTLLNMLAGLLDPTEGKVFFDDQDIYSQSDRERSGMRNQKIAVVPQGCSVLDTLNVMDNILLPLSMYRKTDRDQAEKNRKKALELLKKFGIADLEEAMPAELSGGELRRVSIIRALIMEPVILFADEPTGDLDDENTQEVMRTLRTYADSGNIVVVVSHETGADRYADQIIRMNPGQ